MAKKRGHLVIIGGAEDRRDDKAVLSTVVSLSGGERARMVVLTTASRMADEDAQTAREYEQLYEGAFKDCGAGAVTTLHIHDRQGANDPAMAERVAAASGIFMTGGDQTRLVSILGGTAVGRAMHEAFGGGACVAGTSAGASAIAEHMVAGGSAELLPKKGLVPLAPGLGFLHNVVIDQHFSQRQRLGRLLSVVAQNPFLIGVGIDEDTGLVVTPDRDFEVVGSGAVTVLDGRSMIYTNFNQVESGDVLAMCNVQLHLFPAGFRFALDREEQPERHLGAPATLHEMIATMVAAHRV